MAFVALGQAMFPDRSSIPDWAEWIAQDADGTWWAYEAEPNQQHNGWYENEAGRIQRLGRGAANPDWEISLARVALLFPT